MVTCPLWCSRAARSISMRASRDTRTPSVSTTAPSTFTQPLVIQRSASRREHRPSSPMRFERRGWSGFSGSGRERVMQKAWDGCSACHDIGNSRIDQDNAARTGGGLPPSEKAEPPVFAPRLYGSDVSTQRIEQRDNPDPYQIDA